jgi:hypothetical protein
MSVYSDNYLNWVKENQISGLTGSQYRFVEFILDNSDELAIMGDNTGLFSSVINFIKYSPNFLTSSKEKNKNTDD